MSFHVYYSNNSAWFQYRKKITISKCLKPFAINMTFPGMGTEWPSCWAPPWCSPLTWRPDPRGGWPPLTSGTRGTSCSWASSSSCGSLSSYSSSTDGVSLKTKGWWNGDIFPRIIKSRDRISDFAIFRLFLCLSSGKIRSLLPYQPVYSREMSHKIEMVETK